MSSASLLDKFKSSRKRSRELFGQQGPVCAVESSAKETVAFKVEQLYKKSAAEDGAEEEGAVKSAMKGLRKQRMEEDRGGGGAGGRGKAAQGAMVIVKGESQVMYKNGPGGGSQASKGPQLLPGQVSSKPRVRTSTELVISDRKDAARDIERPAWHAPWRISAVISGHLGWVRSIAVDPTNGECPKSSLRSEASCDRCISSRASSCHPV